MDLITFFLQMLDPVLQKQITLPKKMYLFFIIWKKTLIKCHVDDQDMIRTVKNVKSKMSIDCNDLNMSMVKNIIAHIVKTLKHICSVSFNNGIFPNQMKIGKIPIFKSDEKVCLHITYVFLCFPNSK